MPDSSQKATLKMRG